MKFLLGTEHRVPDKIFDNKYGNSYFKVIRLPNSLETSRVYARGEYPVILLNSFVK